MLTMNSEYDEQSEDKNESELCDIALSDQAEHVIVELNTMHGEARDKVFELIEILKRDKLKDHEINKVLFSRVKFISKRRLYEILPDKYKREYTKKALPDKITIPIEHNVIEQPSREKEFQEWKKEQPNKVPIELEGQNLEQAYNNIMDQEDEEPTPLELAQIEIQQLKDALHKSQQFVSANKLTEEQAKNMTMEAVKQTGMAIPETNVESVIEWLKKQADGVSSFYYDTYGIDLFKNRELSQLKNSGVKVFRRLYFEV